MWKANPRNTLPHSATRYNTHCNTQTCHVSNDILCKANPRNTLPHTATNCNTHCNTQMCHVWSDLTWKKPICAIHYHTRQHTATHTATRKCVMHEAIQCERLTRTRHSTLQHTAAHYSTLKHTAEHYNTLQHAATHCNTLQHTDIWEKRCARTSSGTKCERGDCLGVRYTHCNTHCNTLCNTHCNTRCNTDCNTHCNIHLHNALERESFDIQSNIQCNTPCNIHCKTSYSTHCNTHLQNALECKSFEIPHANVNAPRDKSGKIFQKSARWSFRMVHSVLLIWKSQFVHEFTCTCECWCAPRWVCRYFSNVSSVVFVYTTFSGELNFENFSVANRGRRYEFENTSS